MAGWNRTVASGFNSHQISRVAIPADITAPLVATLTAPKPASAPATLTAPKPASAPATLTATAPSGDRILKPDGSTVYT